MPGKRVGCFITGTDTGVGKTIVATAVLRGLASAGVRATGMKPIAAGAERTPDGLRNDDALALAAASSVSVPYADLNPYCFAQAVAPHLAAREAGITIDLEVIDAAFERLAAQSECVIVEGAGGWLAPVAPRLTIADVAIRLGLPVVLVVGLRLGCLNHARLTAEAIQHRGAELGGWVANSLAAELEWRAENIAALTEILGCEPLALLPYEPAVPQRGFIAPAKLRALSALSGLSF